MKSESGDMCGGFGSLAQQGFLTLFPAREAHRAERETVQILGKGRRRRTFSTRWGRVAKHANKKDEVRNHKGVSKPRLFA